MGDRVFTSVTASRSFCAGWFFVEPFAFNMFFVSVTCRAANFGLLCKTESSMGGSIVGSVVIVFNVSGEAVFTACHVASHRADIGSTR